MCKWKSIPIGQLWEGHASDCCAHKNLPAGVQLVHEMCGFKVHSMKTTAHLTQCWSETLPGLALCKCSQDNNHVLWFVFILPDEPYLGIWKSNTVYGMQEIIPSQAATCVFTFPNRDSFLDAKSKLDCTFQYFQKCWLQVACCTALYITLDITL